MSLRTVVIIPARFNSSRFPGKPLVNILGKPMVVRVAELAASAVGCGNVYVATDDIRIADVVKSCGFHYILTSGGALTGTDRIAEASLSIEADIYINVQGDEPLIDPGDILEIRDAKINNIDCVINGFTWLGDNEDPNNINIPKVIANESGNLVYMSRCALPGFKDSLNAPMGYKKQVCIYAFTKDELNTFASFGRKSYLESSEDIEILRFLEFGKNILMVETSQNSLAVDIPSDVPLVEDALRLVADRNS